jgi:hypothetical protein
MAGKDKHPPLNPKRFATNKRVVVGEKNAGLGAKFEKPAPTRKQQKAAAALALAQENAVKKDKLRAKVAAELKANRGVLGAEGANRLSYIKRKFPSGGMT